MRAQTSQSGRPHYVSFDAGTTPYGRPQTTTRQEDKSSLLWKDFLGGVTKRKRLLQKLRDIADDEGTTSSILKRFLLELRQVTLRLIEDALEIEYRMQLGEQQYRASKGIHLPTLQGYKRLEENDEVYAIAEILTDVDELLGMPRLKVFLPLEFPTSRNPFLLGKSVDDLASMQPPKPQHGNLEDELKVLELMRYKRAAKALLRAEAQVINKIPITLFDIEKLWSKAGDDPYADALIRASLTLLTNYGAKIEDPPRLQYLSGAALNLEPHEFLLYINDYDGKSPIRIDVQSAVRMHIRDFPFDQMSDPASIFLVAWVNSVLSNGIAMTAPTTTSRHSDNQPPDVGGSHAGVRQAVRESLGLGQNYSGRQELNSLQHSHVGEMVELVSSIDKYGVKEIHVEKKAPIMKIQHQNRVRLPDGPKSKSVGLDGVQLKSESPERAVSMDSNKGGGMNPIALAAEIKRRVKQEVSSALKDHDLKRELANPPKPAKEPGAGGHSIAVVDPSKKSNPDEAAAEMETLSSVRYELLKIQQELIRRRVVDPNHYSALSVDLLNAGARGLTTVADAERTSKDLALQESQSERHVPVSEKEIFIGESREARVIVLLLDLVTDTLIARVMRVFPLDMNGEEVTPAELKEGNVRISGKEGREMTCYARISKLIIDRITGHLMDTIMEKKPERRAFLLESLYNQIEEKVEKAPAFRGKLRVDANRVLMTTSLASNGVAADLSIARNHDCTGLVITCTPFSGAGLGSINNGPITVQLADKELQVLLVNQRGLFSLAKSKWSGMEVVAQWLSTRIQVRRIRLIDNETAMSRPPPVEPIRKASLQSVSSGLSLSTEEKSMSSNRAGKVQGGLSGLLEMIASRPADPTSTALVTTDNHDAQAAGGAMAPALSMMDKSPMLLDLLIDRTIDVPKTVTQQWRSRKVPAVPWMRVTMSAWQDIEILHFEVKLYIPHPKVYEHRMAKKKTTKNGLIDFSQFDENDVDFNAVDAFDEKRYRPMVITLGCQLAAPEVAVFGSTELSDERNVALDTHGGEEHPAAFMWNVLTRMHVEFKGTTKDPYAEEANAEDAKNWTMHYDRVLIKEVRSISGTVVKVVVSAAGNELLITAEPMDLDHKPIGSKLMTNREIIDIVNSESWPLSLLQHEQRTLLGHKILDNLKIVNENSSERLEPMSYLETRLLEIVVVSVAPGHPEKETSIGHVEINTHHTLFDCRTLIRHELEKDLVPKLYKFMYKGAPCADRQEGFRKAWECLPRCFIVPKQVKVDGVLVTVGATQLEAGVKAVEQKAKEEKLKEKISRDLKLETGQRRVARKLIPYPIPTLAWVQEGSNDVHFLHDGRPLVTMGDVIRIGDVDGRDYIVGARPRAIMNKHPNSITIEPAFDLTLEMDFQPLRSHKPFPTATESGFSLGVKYLPSAKDLGFTFTFPVAEVEVKEEEEGALALVAQPVDGEKADNDNDDEEELASVQSSVATKKSDADSKSSKKSERKVLGAMWTEVWIWKCIPPVDDTRPKWLQLYHDGKVRYNYDYAERDDRITLFRAHAPFRILEVLCTDVRIREFSGYAQRIDEMAKLTPDYYMELAYKTMCDWFPQFNKGIDSSKFLKLIRETKVFPDMKKPARQAQIELMFEKEVRTPTGIAEKYVNFVGFCHLIQEVSLLRFPQKSKDSSAAKKAEGDLLEEGQHGQGRALDENKSLTSSQEGSLAEDMATKALSNPFQSQSQSQSLSMSSRSTVNVTEAPKSRLLNRKGDLDLMAKHERAAADNLRREQAARSTSNAAGSGAAGSVAGSTGAGASVAGPTKKGKFIKGLGKDYYLDPQHEAHAYSKFIFDYVAVHSAWAHVPWEQTKMVVMRQEAIRYCAASRIAAKFRGGHWHFRYTNCVRRLIRFQAQVRRRLATRRVRQIMSYMLEDWWFRVRYHASTKIASIVRRFLKRCWIVNVFKKKKAQEVAVQKARRFRFKKMRAKEKKQILFKETRRIVGIMCMVTIKRKDTRNYSQDYSMIVSVYIPAHSLAVDFTVEEALMRVYMQQELGVDALSLGDLMDKRYLKRVITARLMIHESRTPGKPPKLFFSKQALAERGGKAVTRGFRSGTDMFVCRLYQTGSDITVQSYHTRSCKVFRSSIDIIALSNWVTSEHRLQNPSDENTPPLLQPERKHDLYCWAIDHLAVDTRKGSFRVLFGCQMLKSRKLEMITKMQSAIRKFLVGPRIVKLYDQFILKVKNSVNEPDNCYYLDIRTGVSSWEKPSLLGWRDLPTKPTFRWVPFTYALEQGNFQHFVNPYTGKYTHLTLDQAATLIQGVVRSFLLQVLRVNVQDIGKMLLLKENAKKEYDKDKRRLVSVINYALLAHIVEHNETLGKRLYLEALDLTDTNALVTRAFAIYLLGTVEAPYQITRKRAEKLLEDAERRDLRGDKFLKAHTYFRFACVRDMKDIQALINLSLVEALIFKRNEKAERLLRRALAISPFEERLVSVWEYLKGRFTFKPLFSAVSRTEIPTKGSKKRVIHGRPLLEHAQWAGWCYVEEDIYFASKKFRDTPYWYNPADHTEELDPPDFKKEWDIRMQRSVFKEEKDGLELYYDPLTSMHFQFHRMSLTFT